MAYRAYLRIVHFNEKPKMNYDDFMNLTSSLSIHLWNKIEIFEPYGPVTSLFVTVIFIIFTAPSILLYRKLHLHGLSGTASYIVSLTLYSNSKLPPNSIVSARALNLH